MRYPHCKGGCGNRLVAQTDHAGNLKGGRRRNFRAGYCEACWTERHAAKAHTDTPLTPEQRVVLTLLETEVADEAERRDFAEALGLVGEPA